MVTSWLKYNQSINWNNNNDNIIIICTRLYNECRETHTNEKLS